MDNIMKAFNLFEEGIKLDYFAVLSLCGMFIDFLSAKSGKERKDIFADLMEVSNEVNQELGAMQI